MKFLQISDSHLDSRPGVSLGLDEGKQRVLVSDIRRAFGRACEIARQERVDIVLAPGDLFDYETADDRTADFIARAVESVSPVPVVIAPGNHDGLRPRSPYIDPSRRWPANAAIFLESGFQTIRFDNLGCSVTGIACVGRGTSDRLLSSRIDRDCSDVSFLLFHGSRDGFRPNDKPGVLPFSDAELDFQGFDYAAIGHYHSHSEIVGTNGGAIGAYSGCVQGRALDEAGEKSVIVGEILPGCKAVIEHRRVGLRTIRAVDIDVTGCGGASDVCARVEQKLASEAFGEDDILRLRLLGGMCEEIEPEAVRVDAFKNLFHVSIDCSGILPEYDLESLASDSRASGLEAAFVRRMREKMLVVPDEDRETYRDAIYYGLDALRGRALRPKRED